MALTRSLYPMKTLINGDIILLAIGKTPVIKDKTLFIEPNDWFAEIAKDYPKLQEEYQRLEPMKNGMNKAKTEALTSVRAQWLRGPDSNRRPIG